MYLFNMLTAILKGESQQKNTASKHGEFGEPDTNEIIALRKKTLATSQLCSAAYRP